MWICFYYLDIKDFWHSQIRGNDLTLLENYCLNKNPKYKWDNDNYGQRRDFQRYVS